jgi:2-methylcitrate dehydratase PrpD
MGATEEKVARFIVETKKSDISAESLKWAKIGSFDCMGVMLAGAAAEPGKILANLIKTLGGIPETTIAGTGLRTSRVLGALGNGTLAHALDYDDMAGWSHPSCVLFPPLISIGEPLGASGKDILDAYVIGFKVGEAINSGCPNYCDEETGWHATSIFGILGATAACARLLKLNVQQTIMALGTVGSMGGGLDQNLGSYTKGLHAGMASHNGVLACLLAKNGWTGTDRLFESNLGFLSAYVGRGAYNLQAIRGYLDERPVNIKVKIKRYPCCGGNHHSLDSLISLLTENNINFDDIDRVVVDDIPATAAPLLYFEPTSGFQGKFSLRYNLATAMLDKRVDIDSFTDAKLQRPQLREALNKVDLHIVIPADARYERKVVGYPVTVVLKDGRSFSRMTEIATMRGAPSNPLTEKELQGKFKANAALSLPKSAVARACDLWWNMEKMANISEGMEAVAQMTAAGV